MMNEFTENELDNITAGYSNRLLVLEEKINKLQRDLENPANSDYERNFILQELSKLQEEYDSYNIKRL